MDSKEFSKQHYIENLWQKTAADGKKLTQDVHPDLSC